VVVEEDGTVGHAPGEEFSGDASEVGEEQSRTSTSQAASVSNHTVASASDV
jgi:hypothetical protein